MTAGCRLAAILAVNVVGYSRLMGEDEAGTGRYPTRLHSRSPLGVVRRTLGTYTSGVGKARLGSGPPKSRAGANTPASPPTFRGKSTHAGDVSGGRVAPDLTLSRWQVTACA
jgi:hypothetical protein